MTPRITRSDFLWDPIRREHYAICELDAWKDYSCIYSNPEYRGATVRLRIATAEGAPLDEINADHLQAANWLLDNQYKLRDSLVGTLYERYPEMLEQWRDWGFDDEDLNGVSSPGDFRRLLDLSYVDIFPQCKDTLPYLGFEFECHWDVEHGFQALMNGLRVVDLYGDVNNEFTIERDGGSL